MIMTTNTDLSVIARCPPVEAGQHFQDEMPKQPTEITPCRRHEELLSSTFVLNETIYHLLEYFRENNVPILMPGAFNSAKSYTVYLKKEKKQNKKKIKKQEKTKKKYTTLSYGMRKKQFENPTPEQKLFELRDEDFPALSGLTMNPANLDNEIAIRSQFETKETVAKRCSSVAFERAKALSSFEKDKDILTRMLSLFAGVQEGALLPAYDCGTAGFVMFRASVLRFLVCRIALYGTEAEARSTISELVALDDNSFLQRACHYIRIYTIPQELENKAKLDITPQINFTPKVDLTHALEREQFETISNQLNTIANSLSQPELEKIGASVAQGALSVVSIQNILPEFVRGAVEGIIDGVASQFGQAAVTLAFLTGLSYHFYHEGFTTRSILWSFFWIAVWSMFTDVRARADSMYQVLSKYIGNFLEPQVMSEDRFISVCTSVISLCTLRNWDGDFTKFPKVVKGFSGLGKDLSSFFHCVIEVVKEIADYVAVDIFHRPPIRFFAEEVPGLDKWTDSVNELVTLSVKGELYKNIENANRVMRLEREGNDYLAQCAKMKSSSHLVMKVRTILQTVSTLRRQFETAGIFNTSSRQQPVTVLLRGKSQIGKTKIMKPLLTRIFARCLGEKYHERLRTDLESFVFNYNPTSTFMDGYYGQEALMIDEYSITPPHLRTEENIQTQLVKFKNTFPVLLNMAELAHKGNNYFTSKFIFMTSNIHDTYADAEGSVADPEAVTNRIDFDVEVHVKPEFATERTAGLPGAERMLDKSKIPETESGYYWGLHNYVLVHHTVVGTRRIVRKEKPIGLEELIDKIAERYEKYKQEVISDRMALDEALDIEYARKERELSPHILPDIPMESIQEGDEDSSTYTATDDSQNFAANWLFKSIRDLTDKGLQEVLLRDLEHSTPGANASFDRTFVGTFRGTIVGGDGLLAALDAIKTPEVEVLYDLCVANPTVLYCLNVVDDETSRKFLRDLKKLVVERNWTTFYKKTITIPIDSVASVTHAIFAIKREWIRVKSFFETQFFFGIDWFKLIMEIATLATTATLVCGAVALLVRVLSGIFSKIGSVFSGSKDSTIDQAVKDYEDIKINPIPPIRTPVGDIPNQPNIHTGEPLPQINDRDRALAKNYTAGRDTAALDIMAKIAKSNWYELWFNGQRRGAGLFVKNSLFVLPAHYKDMMLTTLKPDHIVMLKSVLVQSGVEREEYSFTLAEFYARAVESPDHDILMTDLTSMKRQFRDVTEYFVSESLLKKLTRLNAFIARANGSGGYLAQSVVVQPQDPVAYGVPWRPDFRVRLRFGLSYSLACKKGDCGNFLLIDDVGVDKRKIFGIHTAGDGGCNYGVCSVVSIELLKKLMKSLSIEPQGLWDEPFQTMKIVEENVSPLPGMNSKSSIIKSKFYGKWGPAKKKQARLRNFMIDGVEFDILRNALRGYDFPSPEVPRNVVNVVAKDTVLSVVANCLVTEPLRAVSLETAVCGIAGSPYQPLPRSTSAGYPWNAKPRPGLSGKKRFLGADHTVAAPGDNISRGFDELGFRYNVDAPDWSELKDEILLMLGQIERGERPRVIYTGSKKDELRSLEKVEAGDTRYFAGCPLAYLILFRMFFASFEVLIKQNKIKCGICVGINPLSDDWDLLARDLKAYEHQSAGDFRKFDKSQMHDVLLEIGENIISLFEDRQYNHIRRALWREMIESRHLVGDKIIEFCKSLPSGHPFTTIVNSLYVIFCMRYAWFVAHDYNLLALYDFKRHIGPKSFGDDVTLGMSEYAASVFDKRSLPELISMLGLEFTSEDKVLAYNHRSVLEKHTFLKRGFRYEPAIGKYTAPLSLDTIVEMPYWTKRRDSEQIAELNLASAVLELAMHDSQTFDRIIADFRRGVMSIPGASLPEYSRQSIIELVYGGYNTALAKKMRISLTNMYNTNLEDEPFDRISPVHVELSEDMIVTSDVENQAISINLEPHMDRGTVAETGTGATQGTHPSTTMNNQNDVGAVFLNDAEYEVKAVTMGESFRELASSGDVGVNQRDIMQFLGKPYLYNELTWSTQTANVNLTAFDLPEDLVAQPFYNEKLKGFLNLRGTLEVKVCLNATPFQAGRLLLCYLPYGQYPGAIPGVRGRSLTSRTQLPRVEIDVSCQTEAVMTIPYVSVTTHYNMADQTGGYGRFYLVVYSPLATGAGGPANVGVSIWTRFLDLEITTPYDLTPQVDYTNPITQEKANFQNKPISSALTVASGAFAGFAKIPSLSAIAKPLSWVTAVASGVVSMFGYSKPPVETAVMRIHQQPAAYMANADGTDSCMPLSLMATNAVQPASGFAGSDIDETNITHMAQRYAYLSDVAWPTTAVADTLLYDFSVCPRLLYNTYDDGVWRYRDYLPAGFLALWFSQWRGSMRIKIKIVKTQYHSGRLLITYGYGSFVNEAYLLREIVDVRDKSEVELILPYGWSLPWKPTNYLNDFATQLEPRVRISVISPLRCPTSVAQTVAILVEVAGGPDIEFSVPITTNDLYQYIGDDMIAAQINDDLEPQMDTQGCSLVQGTTIGGCDYPKPLPMANALCVGEACTSILQLCKKFTLLQDEFNSDVVGVRPFAWNVVTTGAVARAYSYTPWGADAYAMFSACFGISRGGMRLRALAGGTSIEHIRAQLLTPAAPATTNSTWATNFQATKVYSTANGARSIEVAVPQYTPGTGRINRPSFANVDNNDIYNSNVRVEFWCWGAAKTWLYRAVADDFQFGHFLGTPAIAIERVA